MVSGQLIHIGKFVGVCAYDAASGQQCEVGAMGVSTLPIDKTGNAVVGVCVTAAPAGTNTVQVRLTPSAV